MFKFHSTLPECTLVGRVLECSAQLSSAQLRLFPSHSHHRQTDIQTERSEIQQSSPENSNKNHRPHSSLPLLFIQFTKPLAHPPSITTLFHNTHPLPLFFESQPPLHCLNPPSLPLSSLLFPFSSYPFFYSLLYQPKENKTKISHRIAPSIPAPIIPPPQTYQPTTNP